MTSAQFDLQSLMLCKNTSKFLKRSIILSFLLICWFFFFTPFNSRRAYHRSIAHAKLRNFSLMQKKFSSLCKKLLSLATQKM